ncbi:MAG TPA: hypothetical protein VH309_05230, partial [Elusimicrobiota bacterium]|nr:hypothetical protein [Elusimicrobiota bacterium]
LPSISGTSDDGIGVSTVSLSVVQIGGNCYSPVLNNFTAACPSTFPAKGTPAAWTFSGIPWISSRAYTATATAVDLAGNATVSSNTFSVLFSTGLGVGVAGDGQGSAGLVPAAATGCQIVGTTTTFTVGPAGIAVGGAIALHVPNGWTQPQGVPGAPGYVSIISPGGYNLQFNPGQAGGANLGPNWIVYYATSALNDGDNVQFVYSGYPAQGLSGPQIFSLESMAGGGGDLSPIAMSPSLTVGAGAPALLAFAPSGAMTVGVSQNSAPMRIQLLDACGLPAVQTGVALPIQLSANANGTADSSALFYSTSGPTAVSSVTVPVGGGASPAFYYNTLIAGVTSEVLVAGATLGGAPVDAQRYVTLLPAPVSIGGATVDTGAPGTSQNATISAGGAAQSVYVNFTLSNSALPWEVIISSMPGTFAPMVADFTGTGNPGRTLVWNGSNKLASPSNFLPPGVYHVEILAGGGSAVNTSLTVTIAPSASVYGLLTTGPGATVSAVGPNAGPGNFAVASSTGYFQIWGLQNGSAYLIQASSNVAVAGSVVAVVAGTSVVATAAGTYAGSLTFQVPSVLEVSATLPFAAPADMFASVSVHNAAFTQTGAASLHFAAGSTTSDNGAQSFGTVASTQSLIEIPPGVYEVDASLPALGISTAVTGVVVSSGPPTLLTIALQKLVNIYGYAILPSTVSANTFVSVQAQSSTPGAANIYGGATVPVAASSAIYSLFGFSAGTWTVTAVSQGALPATGTVVVAGTA